jgi:TM2 domain-containing membrane protein YozV
MTDTNTTTIIIAQPPKSAWAAFFLTFFFGPLGLLYASIAGGIILTVIALIIVPLTAGIGAFVLWPISMIWGVLAAFASKGKPADAA